MNIFNSAGTKRQRTWRSGWVAGLVILAAGSTGALGAEDQTGEVQSPREMYNLGTKKIQAAKWNEAEEALEGALMTQDSPLQPLALYNLGVVRVAQGVEILKKAKDESARASAPRMDSLAMQADGASKAIDDAIASQDEQRMIMAYMRGRGLQREIKDATKAVDKAMEAEKDVLAKYQRADGDFRGAAELKPADADAAFNAQATEKAIAAIIDRRERMQQAAMKMKAAGQQLGEKMKKLKGMIPAPDMPPGAPGDDGDEDQPGMKKGEKEGEGKTGNEMKISPEQAKQLLDGYKLGGDRRLPLGQEGTSKPKDHTGKNW